MKLLFAKSHLKHAALAILGKKIIVLLIKRWLKLWKLLLLLVKNKYDVF